jgi:hypothetical protein
VIDSDSQPATEPEPADEWLTLAAASRVLGCYTGATKSLALTGRVRHRCVGLRVQYHAADCRLRAAAAQGSGAATPV